MSVTPTFRKLLKSIDNEEKLIPLIRQYLWSPEFEGFTVEVTGFEERAPDGWFHPSVHPLWTDMMLYIYLTNYHQMVREPFDPSSTMAVTAGQFFHTFLQTILLREGVLQAFLDCPCGEDHSDAELYLVDEESRSRGHSDGMTFEGDGFEFKTMNTFKLGRVPKGPPSDPDVIEWFRKANPGYYAQAQEYLRLSENERMIVVLLSLTYPFEMREIHVPFDRVYSYKIRDKFRGIIQAVADGRSPRCVCPPDQMCGARAVCSND